MPLIAADMSLVKCQRQPTTEDQVMPAGALALNNTLSRRICILVIDMSDFELVMLNAPIRYPCGRDRHHTHGIKPKSRCHVAVSRTSVPHLKNS